MKVLVIIVLLSSVYCSRNTNEDGVKFKERRIVGGGNYGGFIGLTTYGAGPFLVKGKYDNDDNDRKEYDPKNNVKDYDPKFNGNDGYDDTQNEQPYNDGLLKGDEKKEDEYIEYLGYLGDRGTYLKNIKISVRRLKSFGPKTNPMLSGIPSCYDVGKAPNEMTQRIKCRDKDYQNLVQDRQDWKSDDIGYCDRENRDTYVNGEFKTNVNNTSFDKERNERCDRYFGFNGPSANDGPENLIRPCALDDWQCIRHYFAANSNCKPAYGPIPDPLIIDVNTVFYPHINMTITFPNLMLRGLSSARISEFYVNRVSGNLVLAINVTNLNETTLRAYFRYRRTGKESIVLADYATINYKSIIMTVVIPKVPHLRLDLADIHPDIQDIFPPYFVGPGAFNSTVKALVLVGLLSTVYCSKSSNEDGFKFKERRIVGGGNYGGFIGLTTYGAGPFLVKGKFDDDNYDVQRNDDPKIKNKDDDPKLIGDVGYKEIQNDQNFNDRTFRDDKRKEDEYIEYLGYIGDHGYCNRENRDSYSNGQLQSTTNTTLFDKERNERCDRFFGFNGPTANDGPENLIRPCALDDWQCIRHYFAANSNCKPAYGPIPDPLIIDVNTVLFPVVNMTVALPNLMIKGLSTARITEFYVNRVSGNLVLALNIMNLNQSVPRAYFRYRRTGKESIVLADYATVNFSSVIMTAVIPKVPHLRLDLADIHTDAQNSLPTLFIGPGALNSTDPDVVTAYSQLIALLPFSIREGFLSQAQLFTSIYIQRNICDFGLKIVSL